MKSTIAIILLLMGTNTMQAQLSFSIPSKNIVYNKTLILPNRSIDEIYERNYD